MSDIKNDNSRRGRTSTGKAMTNAQKQAAYRQRCAARNQELQIVSDFQKSFYYQINFEIAQAKKLADKHARLAHQLTFDEGSQGETMKANIYINRLNELKRFKMIMDNKSNVTKTYKQVDIED